MPHPARGSVEIVKRKDGLQTFWLRVTVDGRRQRVRLVLTVTAGRRRARRSSSRSRTRPCRPGRGHPLTCGRPLVKTAIRRFAWLVVLVVVVVALTGQPARRPCQASATMIGRAAIRPLSSVSPVMLSRASP